MKNQKIIIVFLAVLVVIGGAWFLTRDKSELKDANDAAQVENENVEVVEESEENIEEEDTNDASTSDEESDPEDLSEEDVSKDEKPEADIKAGSPAPDFTVENLAGDTVSLSDYQGKIVILNFWATWCGFCDQEMPDLDRFNNDFEDVAVVAVDVMEERPIVADYIEKGGYDFDVVLDLDGEIARTYLIGGYPTSYFIEEDGTLIGRVVGPLEYDKMVEIIESIKAERE